MFVKANKLTYTGSEELCPKMVVYLFDSIYESLSIKYLRDFTIKMSTIKTITCAKAIKIIPYIKHLVVHPGFTINSA